MDLNDGQPLIEVLRRAKRGQPFPLEFRLHLIGEALRFLHAAHERQAKDASGPGSVAQGLSLQSVVVGYDGRVTVEFGTTRDSVDRISTTDGVFQGKLGYVAPEQARGLPGDRRADVFAAGVILWEALALRRFTPKERTRAAVEARISGFEPRIQAVVPDVDPALAAICDRAMHVSPESRFGTADELRLALAAYEQAHFPPVRVRHIGEAMRSLFVRESTAPRRRTEAAEEATTVGDLSVLIQSTLPKSSVPPPARRSVPPLFVEEEPEDDAPNRRPLIIALSAVIVAVGTFLFSMSRQAPPEVDVPSASAAHAETAALTPPALAATATAPTPPPEPEPEPEPAPAPVAELPAAVESAGPVTDASEAPPRRPTARPRSLAPRVKPPPKAPPLRSVHGLDEEDPFK